MTTELNTPKKIEEPLLRIGNGGKVIITNFAYVGMVQKRSTTPTIDADISIFMTPTVLTQLRRKTRILRPALFLEGPSNSIQIVLKSEHHAEQIAEVFNSLGSGTHIYSDSEDLEFLIALFQRFAAKNRGCRPIVNETKELLNAARLESIDILTDLLAGIEDQDNRDALALSLLNLVDWASVESAFPVVLKLYSAANKLHSAANKDQKKSSVLSRLGDKFFAPYVAQYEALLANKELAQ